MNGHPYVTLHLCDADGAHTATLVAFARSADRLPTAARAGDAIRLNRVYREAAMAGEAPASPRRGVAATRPRRGLPATRPRAKNRSFL